MKQSSKSNIRVFSVVIYHGFFSGLWLGCRIHLIAEPFLRCICSLSPMLVRYIDGRHMPHWYCYTLSMDYTATLPWEWFILLLFVFFTCFWGIFARRDSRYWMGWLYRNTRTLRLPVLDLLLPFGDGSEYIFVISVESEAIPNNILGEGRGIFVLLDTLDKLNLIAFPRAASVVRPFRWLLVVTKRNESYWRDWEPFPSRDPQAGACHKGWPI